MKSIMKTSIILPTYNEKESIIELIEVLSLLLEKKGLDFEIIVVDDDSPDGTGELVKERYPDSKNITCIIRKDERGLATAISLGILNASGDYILLMDTDFNHDPMQVPDIIGLLSKCDIVSGSRYITGGGMLGPRYRYWGSYLFNLFIRSAIGLGTTDNLSGFLVFKKDILKNFDIDKIFYGYGDYCIRFLHRAKQLNLKIIEIPVFYKLRYGGSSKTNFLIHSLEYVIAVIKIKIGK